MILSFQRREYEQQLMRTAQAKAKKEMLLERSLDSAEQLQNLSNTKAQIKNSNLFLKNSSNILPPRREQLPQTNVNIKIFKDENNNGIDDDLEQSENGFQAAMGEALQRREKHLERVREMKQTQAKDFKE